MNASFKSKIECKPSNVPFPIRKEPSFSGKPAEGNKILIIEIKIKTPKDR